MKLNNRGWGLSAFIGFVLVFAVFLIIASINAYHVGLADKPGIIFDSNNNSTINYSYIEEKLEAAARSYKNKEYPDYNESLIVKTSTLIEKQYVSNIENCSGYVIIGETSERAYISCGNYITSGYDSSVIN